MGCVMCPLANRTQRLREYTRFPKVAYAWYRGFNKLYELKRDKYETRWSNADDMFWWWMGFEKAPEGIVYPPVVYTKE